MSYYKFTPEQLKNHVHLVNASGPLASQALRNILEQSGMMIKADKESNYARELNLQERLELVCGFINSFCLSDSFPIAVAQKANDDACKRMMADPSDENTKAYFEANTRLRVF